MKTRRAAGHFQMHSPNFNSLGLALALTGVVSQFAAADRRAAWQTREPTRTQVFKTRLFSAEAHVGHRLSRIAAMRRKRK